MRTQISTSSSPTVKAIAIGTPGYMSAEQSQGKPRLNSDIYAVLYDWDSSINWFITKSVPRRSANW